MNKLMALISDHITLTQAACRNALLSSNLIIEVIDGLKVDKSVNFSVSYGEQEVGFGTPFSLQRVRSGY